MNMFPLPPDPLSYLFFASSNPLYRYRPHPLPDFRGGWRRGGDSPVTAPRAQLWPGQDEKALECLLSC